MVPLLVQCGPEERITERRSGKQAKKEPHCLLLKIPLRRLSLPLTPSDWAVRCEEEEEEAPSFFLLPPLPNYLLGPSSFMLLL